MDLLFYPKNALARLFQNAANIIKNLMDYIYHITLSTGDQRKSPRSEVDQSFIDLLSPWLKSALESGKPMPLPVPDLSHYSDKPYSKMGR